MKSLAEIMTFHLRRPRVTNFPDIIKVSTMFIKTTFNDSKKVKPIGNYALKRNLYLYFLIKQKLLISVKKYWRQQNSKGVSRDLYIFWSFFRQVMTVPSFMNVGYVWDILGKWAFLPPIREQARKVPSLIGLTLEKHITLM